MPVTKQAIKKVRQDKRKAQINKKVKDALKRSVTAFKKDSTEANLKAVYKAADRAAKSNVIHKNKAARIKSRLSKKITKGSHSAPTKAKAKKT